MKLLEVSHALLTNIVLAWNTSRMNDAVERMRMAGMAIDDVSLRRIGPVQLGHINFCGSLPLQDRRVRLGATAAGHLFRRRRQRLKPALPVAVPGIEWAVRAKAGQSAWKG